SGLHRPVVHQKGNYFHAVLIEDNTLLDVVRDGSDAGGGEMLVHIAPDVNVEREGLLQIFHHGARSERSPDLEWPAALLARSPGAEIEVGNVDDMIRMQVGD